MTTLMARPAASIAALLLAALNPLAQESPERILPRPQSRVEDRAGVVDARSRARLERVLSSIESETGAEIVFLTIDTTRPVDIANFALQNAQAWNLAESSEAALLVVAVEDRLWHLEVSAGLESAFDAAFIRRLGASALVPRLRQGDVGSALEAAADAMSSRLHEALGLGGSRSAAERRSADRPRRGPPPRHEPRSRGPGCGTGLVGFLVVLFVIGALTRGGTGFGCAGPGCLPGFFLGSLLGGGFGRRRRRSWGGHGPFWGGFGGGGFGSGGGVFRGSGGGGSFGAGTTSSGFGGGGSVFRGSGGGGSW